MICPWSCILTGALAVHIFSGCFFDTCRFAILSRQIFTSRALLASFVEQESILRFILTWSTVEASRHKEA